MDPELEKQLQALVNTIRNQVSALRFHLEIIERDGVSDAVFTTLWFQSIIYDCTQITATLQQVPPRLLEMANEEMKRNSRIWQSQNLAEKDGPMRKTQTEIEAAAQLALTAQEAIKEWSAIRFRQQSGEPGQVVVAALQDKTNGEYKAYVTVEHLTRPQVITFLLSGSDKILVTQIEEGPGPDQEKPVKRDPEACVWEVERRVGGPTSYFIVIVDGENNIKCELKHDPETNSFTADPYVPGDYEYTVHDYCNHEDGECVLDTPEYQQQEWMDTKLSLAIKQLRQSEQQLRQSKVAERLTANDAPPIVGDLEHETRGM